MANLDEDVIELGSSDDEKEPAPKKKKPIPNVMVRIPTKLPEITIKPTSKPKINPISLTKGTIGKGITVTKVTSGSNKVSNPFANKSFVNGKIVVRKQTLPKPNKPVMPITNSGLSVKPVLKRIRQIPVGKIIPVKYAQGISIAPSVVQPLPPGILPPGITVKRTNQLQSTSKRMKPNPINIQAKRNIAALKNKNALNETVCVDLDDDDPASSSVGPQWYLRPEEQDKTADKSTVLVNTSADVENPKDGTKDKTSTSETDTNVFEKDTTPGKEATDLEEQNNKEPETPRYVEITIEDSPAKPPKLRANEVSELAITIEDSPVRGISHKLDDASGSDEETTSIKEKHSKKKLEYPKQSEKGSVEIEIELTPVRDLEKQNVETEIVEIEESPLKPAESFNTSTPKKNQQPKPPIQLKNRSHLKPMLKLSDIRSESALRRQSDENDVKNVSNSGEFHPIYQSFIDLCFHLENSEDMSKIVEKKIKAYYKQVPKEYTQSEMFTDMVSSKISAMKASPEKMYLYIKDIVDELNLQRKIAKAQPVTVVNVNEEQDKFLYGEESEFDSKRQRQIRKLEKTLKKLHRAIQKLEEQEVDFDDEEDSVYLLTESEEDAKDYVQPLEKSELLKRYKERMVRVHAKFCQLSNTKMPSEPRVQIDARPGQPKGPAKRLEKWINKKVPIGTPLPFPDFHDVLRCVRDANQEDKLCWNEADIMEEARDLFTRCGKKLQRRRQENEWRLAASRIQSAIDPAEESENLRKALDDNRREASKTESEVLKKFADRQNQLNLEAVEIGDKEADESPVETDEEEPSEESTSLETKEKRKESLKRLLQKNSVKVTGEKDESDVETKEPENCENLDKEAKETEKPIDEIQLETVDEENDPLTGSPNDLDKNPQSNKQSPLMDSENVLTLSEESSKLDSDMDELHLLQKLHSKAVESSLESSDSESPIAISDTLSSSDNKDKKEANGVISIENSSYSESEKNNEQDYELVSYSQKNITKETVNTQIEIECSTAGVRKLINKSNNDEYNESIEDILLASSDDEANKDDSTPNNKKNITQSEDKSSNKFSAENADITDVSSIESVEITGEKNVNPSYDLTSIASTETGDDDSTNAAEVTSIKSVEIIENDKITDIVEESIASDVPCVNAAETKATDNILTEIKDKTTTSITEKNKINVNSETEEQNDTTSVDNNKNVEATSIKLAVTEGNVDNQEDKADAEVIKNQEAVAADKTKNIDVNDNGVMVSKPLSVPEPMEVDDDKT